MNKMTNRFGLPPDTTLKLKNLFQKYPKIKKVVLYGSRATGKFRDNSDIDISLFAPEMNLSECLKIENEIDDLLLPYKVDLSLFHSIDNPALKKHIEDVGIDF